MLEGRKWDGSFINQDTRGNGLDIHVITNGETVDIVSFPYGRTAWEFFNDQVRRKVDTATVYQMCDRKTGDVLDAR